MLRGNLLSKLKGLCKCTSHFHGNTWGLTNNWSTIIHVSRLLCVLEPSFPTTANNQTLSNDLVTDRIF